MFLLRNYFWGGGFITIAQKITVVTAKRQCFTHHWVDNSKIFHFPQRFKGCWEKRSRKEGDSKNFLIKCSTMSPSNGRKHWGLCKGNLCLELITVKHSRGAEHFLPSLTGFVVMPLKALEIFKLCRVPWLTNTHIPVDFWGSHFHKSYIHTSSRSKNVGAKPG